MLDYFFEIWNRIRFFFWIFCLKLFQTVFNWSLQLTLISFFTREYPLCSSSSSCTLISLPAKTRRFWKSEILIIDNEAVVFTSQTTLYTAPKAPSPSFSKRRSENIKFFLRLWMFPYIFLRWGQSYRFVLQYSFRRSKKAQQWTLQTAEMEWMNLEWSMGCPEISVYPESWVVERTWCCFAGIWRAVIEKVKVVGVEKKEQEKERERVWRKKVK